MLWAPGLPRPCDLMWRQHRRGTSQEGSRQQRTPLHRDPVRPKTHSAHPAPTFGTGLCHSLGRRWEGQPSFSSTSWAPGGHWGQQHLHLGSREGVLNVQGLTIQWGRPSSTVHWPAAGSRVPWHPARPSPTPAWCLGSPSLAGTLEVKAACPARRRRSRWGRGTAWSVQGPSAPQEHPAPPAVAFLLLVSLWLMLPNTFLWKRSSMTVEGVEVRRRCSPKPRELEN